MKVLMHTTLCYLQLRKSYCMRLPLAIVHILILKVFKIQENYLGIKKLHILY